jgi:hypothetical protein
LLSAVATEKVVILQRHRYTHPDARLYMPYGSTMFSSSSPVATNEKRKYMGHCADDATSLSYLSARYYDGPARLQSWRRGKSIALAIKAPTQSPYRLRYRVGRTMQSTSEAPLLHALDQIDADGRPRGPLDPSASRSPQRRPAPRSRCTTAAHQVDDWLIGACQASSTPSKPIKLAAAQISIIVKILFE